MGIPEPSGLRGQHHVVVAEQRALDANHGLTAPAVERVVILLDPWRGDDRGALAQGRLEIGGALEKAQSVALAGDTGPDFLPACRRNPGAGESWRGRERCDEA